MRPVENANAKRTLMEEAAAWRMRQAEGDLSADERAAFETWLAAEKNRAAYAHVQNAWEAVGDVAGEPELVALRGEAFEIARRANRSRWARASLSTRARAIGAAACLLIVVLAGAVWLHLAPRSYETGIGERRVVALADGSRISLDAATEVRVRYDGARRELWLEHGRAKFDVAHDPLRPFSVAAEGRTIVATGTSFSVELLNDAVRVVLYEGAVAVLERASERGPQQAVRIASGGGEDALAPGQELIAASTPGAVARTAPVDPVRSLSWEAGQLVFDDEPLSTAVARMNRYTQKPLAIGDAAAGRMRVSGVFRAGDAAAFVEGVTALLPIRAEARGEAVLLVADAERISQQR